MQVLQQAERMQQDQEHKDQGSPQWKTREPTGRGGSACALKFGPLSAAAGGGAKTLLRSTHWSSGKVEWT